MVKLNFGGHWNRGHVDHETLKFFKRLGCETMLDVGCGIGLNVEFAKDLHGYTTYGIEGDPESIPHRVSEDIFTHDFENDGYFKNKKLPNKIDLGWCVSVSEHIQAKNVPEFLDVFKRCKWVLFTWCPIGFPGYHHVNCQLTSYWQAKFLDIGFRLREDLTTSMKLDARLFMLKNCYWRDKNLNNRGRVQEGYRLLARKKKMYLKKWGLVFQNDKFI